MPWLYQERRLKRSPPDSTVRKVASTFSYTPLALLDLSSMGRVDSTHQWNSNTSKSFARIAARPPHAVMGLLVN